MIFFCNILKQRPKENTFPSKNWLLRYNAFHLHESICYKIILKIYVLECLLLSSLKETTTLVNTKKGGGIIFKRKESYTEKKLQWFCSFLKWNSQSLSVPRKLLSSNQETSLKHLYFFNSIFSRIISNFLLPFFWTWNFYSLITPLLLYSQFSEIKIIVMFYVPAGFLSHLAY